MATPFYESNKNYQRVFTAIQEDKTISKQNKHIAADFLDFLNARETTPARIKKYLEKLKRIAHDSGKDIDKLTIKDVEAFRRNLNGSSYHTRKDYFVTIKLLFKMIHRENYNYSILADVLRLKGDEDELNLDATDLLTPEEIERIVSVTSPMIRAAIMLQYECGLRPTELLTLTVGAADCSNKDYVQVQILQSKTKKRLNYAIIAAPYLRAWLEQHPHKNNSKAPLFPSSYYGTNNVTFLTPPGYAKILKTSAEHAGVKKTRGVWPYLLRHCAITRMLKDRWTIQMIQSVVGHSIGSRTIRKYAHLCSEDVRDYVIEIAKNKENAAADKGEKLSYIICTFCHARNTFDADLCAECNRPVSVKALQAELDKGDEIKTLKAKLQEYETERQNTAKAIAKLAIGLRDMKASQLSELKADIEKHMSEVAKNGKA